MNQKPLCELKRIQCSCCLPILSYGGCSGVIVKCIDPHPVLYVAIILRGSPHAVVLPCVKVLLLSMLCFIPSSKGYQELGARYMQHYSDELFLLGNQGGSWMLQGRPLNFNEADFVHLPSSLCLLIAFIFDPVYNGQIVL